MCTTSTTAPTTDDEKKPLQQQQSRIGFSIIICFCTIIWFCWGKIIDDTKPFLTTSARSWETSCHSWAPASTAATTSQKRRKILNIWTSSTGVIFCNAFLRSWFSPLPWVTVFLKNIWLGILNALIVSIILGINHEHQRATSMQKKERTSRFSKECKTTSFYNKQPNSISSYLGASIWKNKLQNHNFEIDSHKQQRAQHWEFRFRKRHRIGRMEAVWAASIHREYIYDILVIASAAPIHRRTPMTSRGEMRQRCIGHMLCKNAYVHCILHCQFGIYKGVLQDSAARG